MALHHFFLDEQVLADEPERFVLRLSEEDQRHVRAIRLEPGERLSVVDAATDCFVVEVLDPSSEGLVCRIAQRVDADREHPVRLTLVQGLAKGEKMDSVVRQSVEVGVDGVVPLAFERSVVRLDPKKAAKRVQRWQAVARSAAMQSGRRSIPTVAPVQTVPAFLSSLSSDDVVLLCWEEAPLEDALLSRALGLGTSLAGSSQPRRVFVVIGPEGGISPDEARAIEASAARVSAVSLGPSILRTETAGVVACALVFAGVEHALSQAGAPSQVTAPGQAGALGSASASDQSPTGGLAGEA